MKIICIQCPRGCKMEVAEADGMLAVTGNECKRGRSYGLSEYNAPKRTVTTMLVTNDMVYSVKTAKPVPKKYVRQVVAAIKTLEPKGNYEPGDVLMKNVLGLGSDIVITGFTRR